MLEFKSKKNCFLRFAATSSEKKFDNRKQFLLKRRKSSSSWVGFLELKKSLMQTAAHKIRIILFSCIEKWRRWRPQKSVINKFPFKEIKSWFTSVLLHFPPTLKNNLCDLRTFFSQLRMVAINNSFATAFVNFFLSKI